MLMTSPEQEKHLLIQIQPFSVKTSICAKYSCQVGIKDQEAAPILTLKALDFLVAEGVFQPLPSVKFDPDVLAS